MKNYMKRFALLCALVSLSACVTGPKLAPAGMFAANSYSVPLQQDWAYAEVKTEKGNPIKVLTLDGQALNALYLVSDLQEGDSILKERRKENPVPVYYSDFSDLERAEFLTNSLEKGLGYLNLEIDNVAPALFKGYDGISFDISAVTESGLNISGTALMAELENGLSILFFLAPTEYYYASSKAEVEAMIKSLKTGAPAG